MINLIFYRLPTRIFLIFFSLVILLFSSCSLPNQILSTTHKDTPMRIDGMLDFVRSDGSIVASINVEIADTPETQAVCYYSCPCPPECRKSQQIRLFNIMILPSNCEYRNDKYILVSSNYETVIVNRYIKDLLKGIFD